ncbi:hypothetical protein D3C72_1904880 [compost metagenome]
MRLYVRPHAGEGKAGRLQHPVRLQGLQQQAALPVQPGSVAQLGGEAVAAVIVGQRGQVFQLEVQRQHLALHVAAQLVVQQQLALVQRQLG